VHYWLPETFEAVVREVFTGTDGVVLIDPLVDSDLGASAGVAVFEKIEKLAKGLGSYFRSAEELIVSGSSQKEFLAFKSRDLQFL